MHTNSSEHTHTVNTHLEQWAMLRRPGSSWGFGVLLKGTSVVVLKVERALYIHSLHLQFLPARDSNSQPLDYESDSLTIRLQLPPYSDEDKILKVMDIYWLIHYFVEGIQNDHFYLKFIAKSQGGKNAFRKMAASLCSFTHRFVGLLVNSIKQSLLHYMPMVTIQKWGKSTFQVFSPKFACLCNSRSIKDILMPF